MATNTQCVNVSAVRLNKKKKKTYKNIIRNLKCEDNIKLKVNYFYENFIYLKILKKKKKY